MVLGDITAVDRSRWQYRAVKVLNNIVMAGLEAERNPLTWTVTANGTLVGEVDRYRSGWTDAYRRAIFDEWCHVLKAGQPREFGRFTGGTEIRALFTQPTNRGDVEGSLVLVIEPPLDED